MCPGCNLAIRLQRSPLRMTFAGTSVQTRIRRATWVQRLTRPMVFTSRWPGVSLVSDSLTIMTTQGGESGVVGEPGVGVSPGWEVSPGWWVSPG